MSGNNWEALFARIRRDQEIGMPYRPFKLRRMNLTPARRRPVYGWYWALVGPDGRTVVRSEVEASEEIARLGAEAAAAAIIAVVLGLGDRPFDELVEVDNGEWFAGALDAIVTDSGDATAEPGKENS